PRRGRPRAGPAGRWRRRARPARDRGRSASQPFTPRRCAVCLGVPGRVIEVDGLVALVDFWGVRKQVRLDVVDEPVAAGDYLLNPVGYAIRRIPAQQVEATLSLYEELLAVAATDDLMAADVRGEIAAGDRRRGD